ncbi:MAG: metalloregulator ArsR/SmtB family transcription factor [Vampirovibrionales bacterium]
MDTLPFSADKLAKMAQATQCLKALGHPIRLGILCALKNGECNVQQLETMLGTSQSNISQHLNQMKHRDILVSRREGNQVFYQVRDVRMFELLNLLQTIYCGDDDA